MLTSSRSKRKSSGGKYKPYRKKKLYEKANLPVLTTIGKKRLRIARVRGGNIKHKLYATDYANVYVPSEKKYYKLAIKTVSENLANRHYIRRNIITKGAIIETEKGKAKVTSRPGQHGIVNAVLIEQS